MRKSMFDNAESTCAWSEEEAVCEYQRVQFTVRAIVLISVLIACATAPINMFVDFLFEDIISAPTADEYKVDLQSHQLRQRLGRRMSAVAASARGAIRNSISIASNRIAPPHSTILSDVLDLHRARGHYAAAAPLSSPVLRCHFHDLEECV